jgi:GR25 family glycosyltransferase involved in LPS biosynthesis
MVRQNATEAMHVFVINLDRRSDRWIAVSDHLRHLGLDFRRVEAVDGRSLEKPGKCSLVPAAVDACWRSHQKVYALIAEDSGSSNCLVLEDDALLSDQVDWMAFLRALDRYMTQASIDVLQLGLLESRSSTRTRIEAFIRSALSKSLDLLFGREAVTAHDWDCLAYAPGSLRLVPDSFSWGTHCYAISGRAAKAFLGLNTPAFTAPDSFFVCIAKDQEEYRRLKIARVRKSLAIQRSRIEGQGVDSDLELPRCPR